MGRSNVHRNSIIATAAAAALGLTCLATPVHATVYTWTGHALTGLWSQNSFGVTNWVGNVIPVSDYSTELVFSSFFNQGSPVQDIANPFLLNRLTFGGAGFTFSGQALRFVANGGTLPQLVQNSDSSQTINQQVVLGTDITFAGTGSGTVQLNGVVGGVGGAFSLTKTSTGRSC